MNRQLKRVPQFEGVPPEASLLYSRSEFSYGKGNLELRRGGFILSGKVIFAE